MKEIDTEVDRLLHTIGLARYGDKATERNKRMLSLGIALNSDPKVLMIDESGTGIDPVAQGRVWSIVSRVSRDRSVILTTHCMKEAHVLASRAAIMADGKFLRVGSVQHLKVSHGWISLSAEWC
mgnify:FL=1